ncbi:KDO2-lipid IV(A) lauroyltransferase [Aliiruegeria haliotis]|uniref:KDO2-lipid IV(A) lauroyltransferase n=1 Tax=Aliiruegeria haliotis TaxID=1280846 RepID=A0A2T0RZY1_9RHOB|nr:lauroyl acyltransferase [Aliiruegeria haliotis]PRY26737.1 KDO2-lipid IV(A) lauroyltransferase [Aliiruegeria haliotis]
MATSIQKEPGTGGSTGDWLQDRSLRAMIWSARRLPYSARIPAFGALARSAIAPLAGHYRRIEENLDYIFPDMADADRKDIARQSADNTGRVLIENYSSDELAARSARIEPAGDGLADLEAARKKGRTVILLSGHYGNYEAARGCLIARGYTVGGIYRPMKNPYFNAHYIETLQIPGGGPVFPTGRSGTKGFVDYLRGGGIAMLLNDIYIGKGEDLPFLGKPAMTSLSAAEMALKFDAALVPVFATRANNGLDFTVEVDAEIPHSDPRTMTLAYNAALETRVRENPGQWFWTHRRWKRKWNKGAGAAPDLHPAAQSTRQKSR